MYFFTALQLNPRVGDISKNAHTLLSAISSERVCNGRPQIFITPELYLYGYPPRDLIFSDSLYSLQSTYYQSSLVLYHNEHLLVGGILRDKELTYNCIYHVTCDDVKSKFKSIVPTCDVFDESHYFSVVILYLAGITSVDSNP